MRRNLLAAGAAALALVSAAAAARADTSIVELDEDWSGSLGTSLFLGLTGADFRAGSSDFSTHGSYECGCFVVYLNSFSGQDSSGHDFSASGGGSSYSISGTDVSYSGSALAEFAVPSYGSLDFAAKFQSVHGDNDFTFIDGLGIRTTYTQSGAVDFSYSNSTGSTQFLWLSMSLGMVGTVPEPTNAAFLATTLLGFAFASRRFKSRAARLAP